MGFCTTHPRLERGFFIPERVDPVGLGSVLVECFLARSMRRRKRHARACYVREENCECSNSSLDRAERVFFR